MKDDKAPVLQFLMDRAYDRWQETPRMSKEDFWASCSPAERDAVFVGNLNYQVANGGFMQWGPYPHGNGYGTPEVIDRLLTIFRDVNTPASLEVRAFVLEAKDIFDDHNDIDNDEDFDEFADALEVLNDPFYKVNEQMLVDVEAWLIKTYVEAADLAAQKAVEDA